MRATKKKPDAMPALQGSRIVPSGISYHWTADPPLIEPGLDRRPRLRAGFYSGVVV